MPQARSAGFAMLDVLVALLLLAMVLTGTCVVLIQTLRATSDALLATRAVDLAADFTEDLHGVTSAEQADALLAAWRARVATLLPVAGMTPEDFASLTPTPPVTAGDTEPVVEIFELRLRWRAARNETRELILPVAAGFAESSS